MITEKQVRELIDSKLEGSDVYLVDVSVDAANKIRVEIDHNDGISIQRCVEMSRFIENSFDREKDDFELQVSSPGLDKGFKVLRQYHKNIGKEVEVKLKDGQKRKGTLVEVKDGGFTLESVSKQRVEGKKKKQLVTEKLELTFDEIEETKRVITFK